jgi:transcriptional regulator with GAF, ATPase, and Fis domain
LDLFGDSGESAASLSNCIRELGALSAVPHLWGGYEPQRIVDQLLEVLIAALALDFAYVRIEDAPEIIESARPREQLQAIGSLVARRVASEMRLEASSPLTGASVSMAVQPLPHQNGVLVAGSKRPTFPTWSESVFLSAIANQLALWVGVARQLLDGRHVAAKLAERESSHIQLEDENAYLREEVEVALAFGGIVGQSQALHHILAEVELVAPTDATVLVLGESGTGKELLAREIHERSQRATRPLIKVNCSAIPREMFESEFFGHVRGAFTGAVRDRPGRFRLADHGTIFLDEVGDLPLDLQPKLLRVLQEGQYERVGDDTTHSIDVRVIAATNRDLGAEVRAGRFREDLYYRLSVFPMHIPPLRDRKEDIPLLASHFIALVSKKIGIRAGQLNEQQLASLRSYDWPGNVRELQNVIERAVILARGGEIRPDQVLVARTQERRTPATPVPPPGEEILSDEELRRRERANLVAALAKTSGRIYGVGGAAELLGLKPSTLQSRLRALGIRPRERV